MLCYLCFNKRKDIEKLLKVIDLSKTFGDFTVLKNVSLELEKGEILGLVGENGSGKSTFLKTLYGSEDTRDYSGEIHMDSNIINLKNACEAEIFGIGMVHQELSLIDNMMVYQNIKITRENTKYIQFVDAKKDIMDVEKYISEYGINISPISYIKDTSLNLKQFVEILREIDKPNLKLLILDEATASLNKEDSKLLLNIAKKLSNRGVSIIFVSHKLDEIEELCDKIVVLRDGEKVLEMSKENQTFDMAAVIEAMIGKKVIKSQRNLEISKTVKMKNKKLISFNNVNISVGNESLDKVNLDILEGEVLGITGLSGHGKSLLGYGIMGLGKVDGEIYLNGIENNLINLSPRELIQNGIMFLPDERKANGTMLNESIEKNITASSVATGNIFISRYGGFVNKKKIKSYSEKMISKLNIKCEDTKQKLNTLSGGNQQKVCIARAITGNPKIIFIGEPTRGIDIYSKELILNNLLEINQKEGITLVIASSELEELMRICDRIAVTYEGHIVKVFENENLTYEELGLAIAGIGRNLND